MSPRCVQPIEYNDNDL